MIETLVVLGIFTGLGYCLGKRDCNGHTVSESEAEARKNLYAKIREDLAIT